MLEWQLSKYMQADKDAFYGQLQDVMNDIPNHDVKLLIRDMNAKINKRHSLEHVIGPHGSADESNDNGEWMQLFCSINNIYIRNMFFTHKNIHKKMWQSPDGNTCNEIYYISISKWWHSALFDMRTYWGGDIGSDHHLLISSVHLCLKKRKQGG